MNLCESCKTGECSFRKDGRIVHACHSHEAITRSDLAAKDAEIANLKRGPTPDYTGEGSAWVPPNVKPHTFAQMVNEVRDLAFDFGASEQFRDRVADLLGKYIHVEHGSKGEPEQTEAPAVVVPEWDAITFASACVKAGAYAEGDLRDAIKNAETGYNFAASRARAIPADRVLGDGMVAVSREDIDCLSKAIDKIVLDSWARSDAEDASVTALCLAFQPIHLALRANQGGSAT